MIGAAFLAGLVLLTNLLGALPVKIDVDEILRPADGRDLTRAELMAALGESRIVLIGESHADPGHHQVQLAVIEALAARERPVSVGLEMFPADLQPVLDRWSAGALEEDEFLDLTAWYFTWGFDAELYLPILRFARDRRLPLFAMNIRREIPRAVSRGGLASLDQAQAAQIPPLAPAPKAYEIRLHEIFTRHPMMARRSRFENFVDAQRLWDGVMAGAIAARAAAHPGERIVALAGSGHILQGHGIPHQLAAQGWGDFVTLLPWRIEGEWVPRDAADFAWGTPLPPEASEPVSIGVSLDQTEPGAEPGALLSAVSPASIAAQAGLEAGDRILRLGGRPTETAHALARIARTLSAGDVVVEVRRGEQIKRLILRVPEQNQESGTPPSPR